MSQPFTTRAQAAEYGGYDPRIIDPASFEKVRQASPARDPRSSDPTKTGMFRDHTCWRCKDGAKPCAQGSSTQCDNPRARND